MYDTGALIAAQRNERRMWALHKRALERGTVPVVPAGVITEAWRGNDAVLARFLDGTRCEALTASAARAAGVLLAGAAVEAVDATVAETAHRVGGAVVTSNFADLNELAAAGGFALDIIAL